MNFRPFVILILIEFALVSCGPRANKPSGNVGELILTEDVYQTTYVSGNEIGTIDTVRNLDNIYLDYKDIGIASFYFSKYTTSSQKFNLVTYDKGKIDYLYVLQNEKRYKMPVAGICDYDNYVLLHFPGVNNNENSISRHRNNGLYTWYENDLFYVLEKRSGTMYKLTDYIKEDNFDYILGFLCEQNGRFFGTSSYYTHEFIFENNNLSIKSFPYLFYTYVDKYDNLLVYDFNEDSKVMGIYTNRGEFVHFADEYIFGRNVFVDTITNLFYVKIDDNYYYIEEDGSLNYVSNIGVDTNYKMDETTQRLYNDNWYEGWTANIYYKVRIGNRLFEILGNNILGIFELQDSFTYTLQLIDIYSLFSSGADFYYVDNKIIGASLNSIVVINLENLQISEYKEDIDEIKSFGLDDYFNLEIQYGVKANNKIESKTKYFSASEMKLVDKPYNINYKIVF